MVGDVNGDGKDDVVVVHLRVDLEQFAFEFWRRSRAMVRHFHVQQQYGDHQQ